MARLICALAALMCLAAPSEVRAQVWQGSALFGMTPGSALDRRAAALDSLDVGGGFTWGLQVSRLVTPHLAAELSWMTHWSGLEIGTAAGKEHLFEMTVNQLHGNAVFRLRDPAARTRPFLFAGLGPTFLNALGQPAETRLSFGLGGGAEVSFSKWAECARSSGISRRRSATRTRATSAIRSASARARCSRSSSRPD